MEIGPGSFWHLGQCIIYIVVVSTAAGQRDQAKTSHYGKLRKDHSQKIGNRPKNQVGQQGHQNKPGLAHILRSYHKKHSLLQICVKINIFFKTYSMEQFMGKQRQQGKQCPQKKA